MRDNRTAEFAHVRARIDAVQAQCNKLRESWPDRYPVPPEVDAAFTIEESLIDNARGRRIKPHHGDSGG